MSQEKVEIVRRFCEGANREGLCAVVESADPEVEVVPPPKRSEWAVRRGVEQVPEMARQWVVGFARRAYEAVDWGEIESVIEHLDPQVEWVSPGPPFIDASGPQGLGDWLQQANQVWQIWWLQVDDMVETPDGRVVVLSRLCGRGRVTGIKIEQELNGVFTVAKDKITRVEGYFTRKQTLKAAGLRE